MDGKIYTRMYYDEVEVDGKRKFGTSMVAIRNGEVISKAFLANDGQKVTII